MESPALEPGFLFEWNFYGAGIAVGGEIGAMLRFSAALSLEQTATHAH